MSHDVFISYARKDAHHAQLLRARLEAHGFTVWRDLEDLVPGFDWYVALRQAVDHCRVVIAVLTPLWKESEWTKFEAYGADRVIPLVFEGKFLVRKEPESPDKTDRYDWDQSVATPPLSRIEYRDFRDTASARWEELFGTLRKLRLEPPTERKTRFIRMAHDRSRRLLGRDKLLFEVHERMFVGHTNKLGRAGCEVLCGLGGAGKTAFAREYVDRFWRCYQYVVWVEAPRGILAELARTHDLMFPEHADRRSHQEKAETVLHTLRTAEGNRHCLLIVDDAESEETTLPWLPLGGNCHVLITSRDARWTAASVTPTPVKMLELGDATDMLLLAAGRKKPAGPREFSEAVRVATRLDCLPLALEMAGSYVQQQGESFGFADYLRVHEESEKAHLQQHTSGNTTYPTSLFATLKATIKRLSCGPRALLRLASFLAPAAIPFDLWLGAREILREAMSRPELQGGPQSDENAAEKASRTEDSSSPVTLTESEIRGWKDELARYSLIESKDGGKDFVVHRTVLSIETIDAEEDRTHWTGEALKALAAVAPEAGHDASCWEAWSALLPHAALLCMAGDLPVTVPPSLLTGMAGYLWSQGRALEAERHARRALEANLSEGNATNLPVVRSTELLANVCRSLGRFQEALQLFQQAYDARAKIDVEDDEHLAGLENFAAFLAAYGIPQQAREIYEEAHALGRRIHGQNSPALLNLMNNYACFLENRGLLREANELFTRLVKDQSEHQGSQSLAAISARINLAHVRQGLALGESGPAQKAQLDEVEQMYLQALADGSNTVGPAHPALIAARQNLAHLLAVQGKHTEAENQCREILAIAERHTGPRSQTIFETVGILADILRQAGRLEECAAQYQRACEGLYGLLGPRHPQTLRCLEAFGRLLRGASRLEAAAEVLRHLLEGRMMAFRAGGGAREELGRDLQTATALYFDTRRQVGIGEDEIKKEVVKLGAKYGLE